MLIAEAAFAASRNHYPLTGLADVRKRLIGCIVNHDRSDRYGDDQVRAVAAVHRTPHTVAAGFRAVVRPRREVQQGIERGIGSHNDIAALAAVAAIGAAFGDVFFTPETDAPIAAFS